MKKKIKFWLFKKLLSWWINNYGQKMRGTQGLNNFIDTVLKTEL